MLDSMQCKILAVKYLVQKYCMMKNAGEDEE